MGRLSDDELDEALAVAQALNSLRLTAAVAELRERRAQDLTSLTSEDIASLDWCLGFIKMMRGGNDREPFNVHAERAINTLFKLLTRGNR